MRRRRVQNIRNTIDEIDLMVSRNIINLKNLGENENIDIRDNENENEASPMAINKQLPFDTPSSSRSKKVKRYDGHDFINKLFIVVKSVANAIIQPTNAMIEASKTMMETLPNIINGMFLNSNPTKDCDVWTILTDLGISPPFLS